MEDLDLEINNYQLDDLLDLFKLQSNFSKDDLKRVKKIVLDTHPDRSNLPKEYFLFFVKAYKILHSIYGFKDKENQPTIYYVETDEQKEVILSKFKKSKDFNAKFNELFLKNNLQNDDVINGYGEWLKSNEDVDTTSTTLSELHKSFEKKKRSAKEIVVKRDVIGTEETSGSDIIGEVPENYSSNMFSKLQYDDLRKVHRESVVPVDLDDYKSRPVYKNLNDLEKSRNMQNVKPMSIGDAKEYMFSKQRFEIENDTARAFKLAKQIDASEKANNRFMSGFKMLMSE